MSNKSGAKLSTGEYATRTVIDVAAAIAVPVVTFVTVYYVASHGEQLINTVKTKLNKIKNRRKK